MKKTLFLIGLCAVLVSMPVLSATQSISKPADVFNYAKGLKTPTTPDYDGTFVGALGNLYKDEYDEWAFDAYAYLAGVYKGGNVKRILGNIYDLDQVQIGAIGILSTHNFLIGRIQDMDGNKAPIVGFLFYNEEYFVGRIMSLFGPAPHIIGQYTPN